MVPCQLLHSRNHPPHNWCASACQPLRRRQSPTTAFSVGILRCRGMASSRKEKTPLGPPQIPARYFRRQLAATITDFMASAKNWLSALELESILQRGQLCCMHHIQRGHTQSRKYAAACGKRRCRHVDRCWKSGHLLL